MITFFTTAKAFIDKTKDSQLNALRSWLMLHKDIEVFVFEEPDGIDLAKIDSRITIVSEVQKDFEIPRVDFMFDYASTNAKNKLVCFINCDIILTSEFINIAHKHLYALKDNFLAVGQRWDFENNNGEWKFDDNWEERYLTNVEKIIHPPSGSDYFLFPKGQYRHSEMAPLIVGRPGWDLWMIYDARKRGFKTIDLSMKYKVYHQNHDYSHKKVQFASNLEEPEAQKNLSFLPPDGKYDFTLFACEYYLNIDFVIKKLFSRGDRIKYLRINFLLGKKQFLSKLKFRLFAKENLK